MEGALQYLQTTFPLYTEKTQNRNAAPSSPARTDFFNLKIISVAGKNNRVAHSLFGRELVGENLEQNDYVLLTKAIAQTTTTKANKISPVTYSTNDINTIKK